uniref:RDD domain-containing protein n=1 Tax=Candidatus Nitrotoga fabula TaxID=2182327 RepID=A0A2X0QXF5_9PROT|nr:membrane protein of unknown function [Candidatus Nitrotoga fabula]
MAYEDPNAPPPTFKGFAQEPKSPVDQSKSFLGGQHHPWRRLFARTVDICTAGFLLFLLLIFALSAMMPEQAAGFAKAMENPIIANVMQILVWVPAESVFLSLFGTTPAKWLFGIKVVHPGGELLSIPEALNRSFLVFLQGVGLGIPFVALFTQLFAYRRLTKTGTTLWDTSANAVILHKKWGVLRALVCTAAVISVPILMSALNAVGN